MKFKLVVAYIIFIIFVLFISDLLLQNIYSLGKPLKYFISPDFGYALRENQVMTRDKKHFISINNLGMRNKENFVADKNEEIILFFGDSVVYGGSYVDDDDTFSFRVCEKLIPNNGKKKFCGNFGINAYGITNINERFSSIKNKIKYKYSIVLLTSGNIKRGKTSISGQPFFSKEIKPPFKGIKELLFFYVDKIRLRLRYSSTNKSEAEKYDKYYYENTQGKVKKNIEIFFNKQITNLFENLESEGTNYLVIYLASKNEYLNKEEYLQKKILKDIAKSKNYNLLIIDDFDDAKIDKIFYDNIHLTKFGHKFISELIIDEIDDKLY